MGLNTHLIRAPMALSAVHEMLPDWRGSTDDSSDVPSDSDESAFSEKLTGKRSAPERDRPATKSVCTASLGYGFQKRAWVFDENVAANWDNELQGHIPNYFHVNDLIAKVVYKAHGLNSRVLSIWCSVGHQFKPYLDMGWKAQNLVMFSILMIT